MEITFQYELGTLVTTKPFKLEGKMIFPKPNERYEIMGRAYTESKGEGKTFQAAKLYYCRPVAVFANKNKVYTVKESDITIWKPPVI